MIERLARAPSVIEYRPPDSLRRNLRNARTHSKRQLRKIADSIERFGFNNPIIVDEHDRIIAGHGRVQAAISLKLKSVPTIRIEGMSEAEKRAYVLADNRVAEDAGWDRAILAIELGELSDLLPLVGLDLTATGFELGEVDPILFDHDDAGSEPADVAPEVREDAVTRSGDLWRLGAHKVLCGDAQSGADVRRLMMGESARMMFADPPYNVPVAGHVSGRGRTQHKEFAFASGDMTPKEFLGFLHTTLGHAALVSLPGSLHYVCMDWRHVADLIAAGQKVYEAMLNVCVWCKTNGGQGSFYRSQHEFVVVFRVAGGAHQNNVELGKHGRNRSNVWTYAGVNSFGAGRDQALAMHPTVKPIALVADAMRDCTTKGDVVLDPFLGSGTTLMAAEKIGRRARGLEFEPTYVDVAIRRWEAYTRRDALLEGDGRTFGEVEAERRLGATSVGVEPPQGLETGVGGER
jgi:DNA modification methylase